MFYLSAAQPETAVLLHYKRLSNSGCKCISEAVCSPFCYTGLVTFGMSTSNSNCYTVAVSKGSLPGHLPCALQAIIESNRHVAAGDGMCNSVELREIDEQSAGYVGMRLCTINSNALVVAYPCDTQVLE